jgi:hypothetical protein
MEFIPEPREKSQTEKAKWWSYKKYYGEQRYVFTDSI